ncbi:MAG: twin-arginine translocase subunit TatC [Candidatus Pacebacteria bacterium]|nr:twin-arginine translocase subunit TatC [Candidatus Paceibacterota bacterium]MBP9866876.1 twin-arginine translocase subunit TatC [Candidatus Paceibacterota bacterium]
MQEETIEEIHKPSILQEYYVYLEDMRVLLYQSTILFIITFIVGFIFSGKIIQLFLTLFDIKSVSVVVTSPFQFLDLATDISLFIALFISIPFTIIRIYMFLRPAISKSELRSFFFAIPISFILFIFGTLYGFTSLYYGLQIIAQVNVSFGLQNLWDVGTFIAQLSTTAVILGGLFQFPLFIFLLSKLGIVTRKMLVHRRKIAYSTIIIVVALLPPTDGLSLIIMSLPLIILYELMILFS